MKQYRAKNDPWDDSWLIQRKIVGVWFTVRYVFRATETDVENLLAKLRKPQII